MGHDSTTLHTILVVDDEDVVRTALELMLDALGYTVMLCQSGDEAIEHFKSHADDIDLVILDLMMPGRDGFETLTELREINPDVPILLSSGYSENHLKDGAITQVVGFLEKPFSLNTLQQAVNNAIPA